MTMVAVVAAMQHVGASLCCTAPPQFLSTIEQIGVVATIWMSQKHKARRSSHPNLVVAGSDPPKLSQRIAPAVYRVRGVPSSTVGKRSIIISCREERTASNTEMYVSDVKAQLQTLHVRDVDVEDARWKIIQSQRTLPMEETR